MGSLAATGRPGTVRAVGPTLPRLGLTAPVALCAAQPALAESRDRLLLDGFRAYHSVCNHCHGPDGLGSSFGPSLVENPTEHDVFMAVVRDGAAGSAGVMKGFGGNPDVMRRAEAIFAYVEARRSGELGRGRPMQKP